MAYVRQISFRADDEFLARLHSVASTYAKPGLALSLSDALRMTITAGLEHLESQRKTKPANARKTRRSAG